MTAREICISLAGVTDRAAKLALAQSVARKLAAAETVPVCGQPCLGSVRGPVVVLVPDHAMLLAAVAWHEYGVAAAQAIAPPLPNADEGPVWTRPGRGKRKARPKNKKNNNDDDDNDDGDAIVDNEDGENLDETAAADDADLVGAEAEEYAEWDDIIDEANDDFTAKPMDQR